MIGSGSDREIPISALENLTESGVTVLVLNRSDDAVGLVDVECGYYSDSYDIQNGNVAVCLNVGYAGNITSFRKFSVSMETGGWNFTVFTIPSNYTGSATNFGYITTDSYIDTSEDNSYLDCSFKTDLFHALVIAEKF